MIGQMSLRTDGNGTGMWKRITLPLSRDLARWPQSQQQDATPTAGGDKSSSRHGDAVIRLRVLVQHCFRDFPQSVL